MRRPELRLDDLITFLTPAENAKPNRNGFMILPLAGSVEPAIMNSILIVDSEDESIGSGEENVIPEKACKAAGFRWR
jgi:hypothetical protein